MDYKHFAPSGLKLFFLFFLSLAFFYVGVFGFFTIILALFDPEITIMSALKDFPNLLKGLSFFEHYFFVFVIFYLIILPWRSNNVNTNFLLALPLAQNEKILITTVTYRAGWMMITNEKIYLLQKYRTFSEKFYNVSFNLNDIDNISFAENPIKLEFSISKKSKKWKILEFKNALIKPNELIIKTATSEYVFLVFNGAELKEELEKLISAAK